MTWLTMAALAAEPGAWPPAEPIRLERAGAGHFEPGHVMGTTMLDETTALVRKSDGSLVRLDLRTGARVVLAPDASGVAVSPSLARIAVTPRSSALGATVSVGQPGEWLQAGSCRFPRGPRFHGEDEIGVICRLDRGQQLHVFGISDAGVEQTASLDIPCTPMAWAWPAASDHAVFSCNQRGSWRVHMRTGAVDAFMPKWGECAPLLAVGDTIACARRAEDAWVLELWDVDEHTMVKRLYSGNQRVVSMDHAAGQIVVQHWDQLVHYDLEGNRRTIARTTVDSLSLSPDGTTIGVRVANRLHHFPTGGAPTRSWDRWSKPIARVEISDDGRHLLEVRQSSNGRALARLWDVPTATPIRSVRFRELIHLSGDGEAILLRADGAGPGITRHPARRRARMLHMQSWDGRVLGHFPRLGGLRAARPWPNGAGMFWCETEAVGSLPLNSDGPPLFETEFGCRDVVPTGEDGVITVPLRDAQPHLVTPQSVVPLDEDTDAPEITYPHPMAAIARDAPVWAWLDGDTIVVEHLPSP